MKRLYYLADDIDHAEYIANELAHYPSHHAHVQVLSLDELGLSTHQLQSASYLARVDVLHRGRQGFVLGLVLGLLTLFALRSLGLAPIDSSGQMALVALFSLMLGWAGCLIGLNQENHHLACFHQDIESGRTLLMIDVSQSEVGKVKAIVGHIKRNDLSGKNSLPVYAGESQSLAL
jgi:hypothetical protein